MFLARELVWKKAHDWMGKIVRVVLLHRVLRYGREYERFPKIERSRIKGRD